MILAALLSAPRLSPAQAPQGHLASLFPAGGQQGQTIELTASGTDLDEAKGVQVTGPGVAGKVVKVTEGKSVLLAVAIAPDAPPGQRDLRLVTAGGLSNRARFVVGQLPEVREKEPNSDLASAEALPALPVVVNGQILQADRDVFRISARAGQTLVCRVEAQALLPFIADAVPGWFQPVLALYDASGRCLAEVDDFRFHPDPVLIHRVERDGEYRVDIRDAIYRGREDFVYRMSLGELPFLTHLYPLGGQRGTAAKVNLFGANLPAQQIDVVLTPDDPPLRWIQTSREKVLSNALPLAVGNLREVEEVEPNDSPERAGSLELPVTINGRVGKPGDVDCFVLAARPQETLVLEVHARRLGSPLDSILSLVNPAGAPVAQNDDAEDPAAPEITHHADSRILHTFTAGRHVLRIADVQGKGGPEYAYRLSIGPPRPDFQLRVTPDNPRVGQGATTVLVVHALRRDGFTGPIELIVEGLPKGFTASGTMIPAEASEVLLTLTASEDAPLGLLSPQVLGSAAIDGQRITHPALPVEDVMQAFIYHHLLPTDEFALAVVEPGPFTLIPVMPEGYIRFEAGRTAYLDIKAVRKPEAKGPIRLTLSNPPKGVRMKPARIAPGEDTVRVEITYPNQLPATVTFNLIVSGTMNVGPKTLTSLTPAIPALGPGAKAPQGK